jgi:predicted nucleic acid-binding Zn ribbon protein
MAKPESISAIIDRQLAGLGITRRVKEASVEHLWPELVGPEIAGHTRVIKVDDGRVLVAVDSPTWRQELLYQKDAFIAKINQELDEALVRDIMFTGP